jgi:hypothetical protein
MNCGTLTAERLRELLDYDPATGVFTWRLVNRRAFRAKAGDRAGTRPDGAGYLPIGVDGKVYRAHRLAWLHVHGTWPFGVIDHINGIRHDNRIENLRDVPVKINAQNQRRAVSTNLAGMQGVWTPRGRAKKFAAYIIANGIRIRLGSFDTADLAHAAYMDAKRRLHEGCTV